MKFVSFFAFLMLLSIIPIVYAEPQITIDEAPSQTEPPFTINDNASNVLFRILSDGQAIIDQFVQLSGSGLTQIRTYVFPDSSGTVVLEGTSQTLTSKTIDADSNTITNIDDSEIKAGANIALSKLATDPLARASHTGTQTASTISDFDSQVHLSRLDQMSSPTSDVSMNNQKITNLATPTSSTDATTKSYVDGIAQGLEIKNSVRVATTTSGTLATDFENGDTIDGVVLATGNRILIKDQVAGTENGIYTINVSGSPSRSTDADQDAEVNSGMFVFVREGTINAKTGFALTTDDPITLGTTSLVFTQFSGVPSGESNTASNVGTGSGLFKQKTALDLEFKSLIGTTGVNIASNTNDLTFSLSNVPKGSISSTGTWSAAEIPNLDTSKITTGTFTGSFIANNEIDNTKLADVPTQTFKGRTTAATGDPEDLTVTQATAMLNTFTSSLKGLTPASGGGTTNFLRADGSWNPAEVNTASNLGAGNGWFSTKSGSDLQFKSLIVGGGITATPNTNDITLGLASIPKGSISSTGTWTAAEVPNLDASKITTGTFSKSIQNSATIYNDQANTYTSGMKQTFSSSASTAGLRFAGVSGNPSSLTNGDVWYDSTANKFKAREGGITKSIIPNTVARDYVRTGGTNWYSLNTGHTAPTNTAVTTNVIRAFPLIAGANGFSADRLAIDVGTSAASSNCIVGIYTDTGNLYPSTKVIDSGVFATATTGIKSATVSFSLNPGTLYWAVYNCTGTPSLRSHAVNSIPPVLGFTGITGAGQNIVGYTAARTYDGTLPTSFPAGASDLLNTNAPILLMRAS